MIEIVYYSSPSENTKRFVDKLGLPSERIPMRKSDGSLLVSKPYVLVTPTYGGGNERASVPKQVIKFLNEEANRDNLIAVVGTGNTNFYDTYCQAADIISAKCEVPVAGRVELLGTPEDVRIIREKIKGYEYERICY